MTIIPRDMPKRSKDYLFKKGKDNPMYGRNEELNPTWKGNNVGYSGIHKWLCKSCHRKKDIGKMTDEEVEMIRNSKLPQKQLAVIYHVNQCTISRIKNLKRRVIK